VITIEVSPFESVEDVMLMAKAFGARPLIWPETTEYEVIETNKTDTDGVDGKD